MKKFEYKCWNGDINLNNKNDVVNDWVYSVANEQGNLDFLNDEDFHEEVNYAYVLDRAAFTSSRPDNYWDEELKTCGISKKDVDGIAYTESDIEADFNECLDDDSDRKFFAGFYALKLVLFDTEPDTDLVERFYHRFCEVDPDDFDEIDDEA